MANELKIVIPSRPYAKKNNPQAYCISGCKGWRRGQGKQPKKIVIPSAEYLEYEKYCLKYLQRWGNIQFTEPVIMECFYWMPDNRSRPDLLGLLQATADILEKSRILFNDRLVKKVGDSCIMGISKQNPRVEINIRELP